jgi:cob(I)alamin adenosyltransferase
MVYLSKIYTRTGDDGTTALGDGTRVGKTHPRIDAYGTADELGAIIGLAAAFCEDADVIASLRRIQNDLFDLGADLCVPEHEGDTAPHLRLDAAKVDRLEAEIDAMNKELQPLKSFVLSGGTPAGAHLHHARTVARRCERAVLHLAGVDPVNEVVPRYLNRLSDHLFVTARFLNRQGDDEILWAPGGDEAKPEA